MPWGIVKLKKGKKIMNMERIGTLFFFLFFSETLISARFGPYWAELENKKKKGFTMDARAAASMAARCIHVCRTRVQRPGAALVLPRLGL